MAAAIFNIFRPLVSNEWLEPQKTLIQISVSLVALAAFSVALYAARPVTLPTAFAAVAIGVFSAHLLLVIELFRALIAADNLALETFTSLKTTGSKVYHAANRIVTNRELFERLVRDYGENAEVLNRQFHFCDTNPDTLFSLAANYHVSLDIFKRLADNPLITVDSEPFKTLSDEKLHYLIMTTKATDSRYSLTHETMSYVLAHRPAELIDLLITQFGLDPNTADPLNKNRTPLAKIVFSLRLPPSDPENQGFTIRSRPLNAETDYLLDQVRTLIKHKAVVTPQMVNSCDSPEPNEHPEWALPQLKAILEKALKEQQAGTPD